MPDNKLFELAKRVDAKLLNIFGPEKLWNFKAINSFSLDDNGNPLQYWESWQDSILKKYSTKVGMPRYVYTSMWPESLYIHCTHKNSYYDDEKLPRSIKKYEEGDKDVPIDFSGRSNYFDSEYCKKTVISTPTLGWNFKDLIPKIEFFYTTENYSCRSYNYIKSDLRSIQNIVNKTISTKDVKVDINHINDINIISSHRLIFSRDCGFGPGSGFFLDNYDDLSFSNSCPDINWDYNDNIWEKKTVINKIINIFKRYKVLLPVEEGIQICISSSKSDKENVMFKIKFPYGNMDIPKAKGIILEMKPIEDLDWYCDFIKTYELSAHSIETVDDLWWASALDHDIIKKIVNKRTKFNDVNLKDYISYNKLKKAIKEKKIFLKPFYRIDDDLIHDVEVLGPEIFNKFFNIIKVE